MKKENAVKNKHLRASEDYGVWAALIVLVLFVIGVLLLAAKAGVSFVANFHTSQRTHCTVTEKDLRLNTGQRNSSLRVYTSCGTFRIGDVMQQGVFDSSSIYAKLQPNRTYDFEVSGVRVPSLSLFPTVIEVKPVD